MEKGEWLGVKDNLKDSKLKPISNANKTPDSFPTQHKDLDINCNSNNSNTL